MVRLKVKTFKTGIIIKNCISIPYGAIKSPEFNHLLIALPKFQFLMVRLKGQIEKYLYQIIKLFQFLMVRLKVIKDKERKDYLLNFNSLWCD